MVGNLFSSWSFIRPFFSVTRLYIHLYSHLISLSQCELVSVCWVGRLIPSSTLLFHYFPLLLLFTLCNHWGAGVTLPLNADLQKSNHSPSILHCLIFDSLFLAAYSSISFSICVCLWPSLLSLVYITWLISLSSLLFLPDSFYISQSWSSEAFSGVVWSE